MSKLTKPVSTQIVLESLKKKAGPLVKRLESSDIATNNDFDKAAGDLKALKALGKEATAQLNTIIDPLKQATAAAKKVFEPFFAQLANVEESVKQKLLGFKADQDHKAMKVMDDYESGKIKKTGTVIAKQQELAVSSDNASIRKLWRANCLNEKATPREFLVPDEKSILAALKEGKKVKGWELKQIDSIAV
jgi:hypothetical protein